MLSLILTQNRETTILRSLATLGIGGWARKLLTQQTGVKGYFIDKQLGKASCCVNRLEKRCGKLAVNFHALADVKFCVKSSAF